MRCHDECSLFTTLKQLLLAFFLETCIADGDEFIDQVAIELNSQRQAKGKPGAHTRRVVLYRLLQLRTKFGEIINPFQ